MVNMTVCFVPTAVPSVLAVRRQRMVIGLGLEKVNEFAVSFLVRLADRRTPGQMESSS